MARDTIPHRPTSVSVRSVRVEVVKGPNKGLAKSTDGDTISVGTETNNSLVLSDPTVSRYHLDLHHLGDRILVEDLGSTNGTLAGSIWIRHAEIEPGTQLSIGTSTLLVEDGEPVELSVYNDERFFHVLGRSSEMRKLLARLEKVSQSDVSVLLLGETGAGKEVFARSIHDASQRCNGPYETVDCGALAPALIASELFGHEKGAFTGAGQRHIGAFERADGGTLFLDEIGELPQSLQSTLLGVLERKSFRRVGGTEPINVDVRVVCATHRDLRAEVNAGTFRQDLYYRIAVALMRIPPLRARVDDIPLLVEHFMREAGHMGPIEEMFPKSAIVMLQQHRWPGNVRELRNFIEVTLAMGERPDIMEDGVDSDAIPRDFPSKPLAQLCLLEFKEARSTVLREFETKYLELLLERCDNNVTHAARESGIHRSYLNQMLKRCRLR